MSAQIRKVMEKRQRGEGGFTLIELLVVVIIIGILAAIAIPVFLNQRKKGWDAQAKADLKNMATAEETYLTDNNSYVGGTVTASSNPLSDSGFEFSQTSDYTGGTQSITATVRNTNQSYCLHATSASGTAWYYDSANGGLLAKGQTCS